MTSTNNKVDTDPAGAPDKGVGCGALVGRLANDIARCNGSGSIEDGVQYWREGCDKCLRRTALRPEHVWMMTPPPIIAFECEYLIEPNTKTCRDCGANDHE